MTTYPYDRLLHTEDQILRLDAWGPIFVFGAPRSGTTFLTECLARIPGAEAFFGTPYLERWMHLLGSGKLSQDLQEEVLWGIRNALWRTLVHRRTSHGEILRQIFLGRKTWQDLWRRSFGTPPQGVLIYQEPFAAFAAQTLASHFPNAKFLHILRDGRDVADSLDRTYPQALSDAVLRDVQLWRQVGTEIGLARPWKNGWWVPWWVCEGEEEAFVSASKFGRGVWMWREIVQRAQGLRSALGPQRYLEIRYEDLCRQPEQVGAQILQFVGRNADKRYWKFLRRAHTRSIGLHRRRSPEELQEAETFAGDLLKALGYLGPSQEDTKP